MEMFLLAFALSLVGVVVSGALFSVAVRDEAREPAVARRAQAPALAASARRSLGDGGGFFVDVPPAMPPAIPIDALLLQIEQHVRLEQAAAEAFLHAPTRQSLYSRTMSPLVH
jgi:hypothetical protein